MSIDKLAEMVETVSIYNDSLEHLMFYELDKDFFQDFYSDDPFAAVKAWAFGGDNSLFHEYVKFDGNGNLETFPTWKRDEILLEHKDEIVEEYNKQQDTDLSSAKTTWKISNVSAW
jgi:hypothetical protein